MMHSTHFLECLHQHDSILVHWWGVISEWLYLTGAMCFVLPSWNIIQPSFSKSTNSEGRKEMFYLTMHSTHFIYGFMVKDQSERERGNPPLPHGPIVSISSKGSFICIIPQTGYLIPQPLLHQSWSTGWMTGWNEK